MRKLLPFLLVCLGPCFALSQNPTLYPANTYRPPVSHALKLSGTFGELRADHFHMGIDIKSAHQASGDQIFAVADGFISRLKVSAFGYGNSLYIDHPNGTRSVYAHLDTYVSSIQAFLDSVHYAQESFELDIELSPKQFPVTPGQQIGTLGNTGSSQGPHLHFELRLSENDAAFNPLLYDFPVSDHQAPSLRGLSVYTMAENQRPQLLKRENLVKRGNSYGLAKTLLLPPGEVAFGLKAYDMQEGTSNLNGLYRLSARVDGQTFWQSSYDTIAFEQTRYIQANYDFPARANGQGYYYRLHRLPGDRLPIHEIVSNGGALSLGFGESRKVEIIASDPFGNTSTLQFTIQGDSVKSSFRPAPYNFLLQPNRSSHFDLGDAEIEVPAQAVYTDTYLAASIAASTVATAYSRCYQLGNDEEPIHDAIKVSLPLEAVPMALRSRAYFGKCTGTKASLVMPGKLSSDGSRLVGELKNWSDFAVYVDLQPPTIRKVSRLVYTIDDEVNKSRQLRYRVSQNGRWVLAAFDAKRKRLELRGDKVSAEPLLIEVWDMAGNRAEFRG